MSNGARWTADTFELVHRITGRESIEVHISPIDDIEAHIIEVCAAVESDEQPCRCGPAVTLEDDDMYMIVHNSFDGREIIEELERA